MQYRSQHPVGLSKSANLRPAKALRRVCAETQLYAGVSRTVSVALYERPRDSVAVNQPRPNESRESINHCAHIISERIEHRTGAARFDVFLNLRATFFGRS